MKEFPYKINVDTLSNLVYRYFGRKPYEHILSEVTNMYMQTHTPTLVQGERRHTSTLVQGRGGCDWNPPPFHSFMLQYFVRFLP